MKYRGNVSQTFLKSLFNRIDKERTSLHGEAQEKLSLLSLQCLAIL